MTRTSLSRRTALPRNLALFAMLVFSAACGDRGAPTLTEPPPGSPDGGSGFVSPMLQSADGISYVSTASTQTNGSSISIARPSGVVAGDVMIAQVAVQGAPVVSQAPADWTLIRGDRDGTHAGSWIYWKRAGASEPTSYTWSVSASTRIAGGITAYRNVTASGTPVGAHGALFNSGSSANITAPSLNASTAGSWLVGIYSAASVAKETTLRFQPPTGMTEHYDLSTQMKGNQRNVVAMQASLGLSSTGATGTRTAVLNAARPGWGQVIVLTPSAAPPPANSTPVANAGGPYTGQEGIPIAFDGSASTDPDGDALTYSWTFGDGASATGVKPSHTYADNGSFNVVLTVTDVYGAAHQHATTATVSNAAPIPTLTLTPSSVAPGQAVTATGSFTDGGTADAPWSWAIDWGDGTVSTGSVTSTTASISAQHAYAVTGSFAVRLTVTDKDGAAGIAQQTVVVTTTTTAVKWVWSGGQAANGAMVRTRLSAASSNVRLRVSTDSLFGTYVETATAATGGNNVATFMLSGLAANTRYHYRPVVDGTADPLFQGAFRTLPQPGTAHSFTFALGSCQITTTTSLIFDHIRGTAPLFWLQSGDIHYRNISTNSVSLFHDAYNALHDHAPQAALFRSTGFVHVWDDHDGAGGNNTHAGRTGWAAAKQAYRENVPHQPLVEGAGGSIYHSFVVGRVRFIISDLRSARSDHLATDDASKTMLGAAQKAHFKAELAAAKANGQFIAWLTGVPWIAATTAGADHWGGFNTERRELAAYIDSIGVGARMFAISGDMHATAIDTGLNNAWGGFALFHAAPVDQSASTKGGPYTHGPFTSSLGQFGVVSITDTGGSTIQVTFTGRRAGDPISGASYQFTLTLN